MKILTIIVTFNGLKWMERCLGSVEASTVKSDTYIVDNGSTDGTQEYIKNNFPNMMFHQSEVNLGFGKANNMGILYAVEHGYDYVYLLNQDAWVEPNVFATLIDIMECNSQYGIVSPLQLTGDGKAVDKNFLQETISPRLCPLLLNDYVLQKSTELYDTTFVMAAHWMVKVSAIKKAGMFSDAFPHYGEDDNLIARMLFHGMKVGICPICKGYHDRAYRIDPPNKEVYRCYSNILTALHNISISREKRKKKIIKSMSELVGTKGASIGLKAKYLWKFLMRVSSSRRYRQLYKRPDYFVLQKSTFGKDTATAIPKEVGFLSESKK